MTPDEVLSLVAVTDDYFLAAVRLSLKSLTRCLDALDDSTEENKAIKRGIVDRLNKVCDLRDLIDGKEVAK